MVFKRSFLLQKLNFSIKTLFSIFMEKISFSGKKFGVSEFSGTFELHKIGEKKACYTTFDCS